ncbi:E3 ubiquitin-protein ligase DZIP3-like, partial [Mizuhopecten yessoensis]|uniref:E3 ubiquitin-protein ligase DZIP3-like n=1 Tax=Mizuhopecten yessoensis TaxID=6573 RepID=UPI000B45A0B7
HLPLPKSPTTVLMMASKYLPSRETTYFARLSKLVVDVFCDILREVLKAKVPPPGLTAILQSQRVQLSNNLENRQRHVLYPAGGVFVGTLKDLDFTLLYRLVRHIQGINIPPHQNGWGKTPDTADRSLSANIDRLRIQRNEAYGHLPTASLSDSDFHSRWSLIRQSVLEIERDALTGDTYVTAVYGLLTVSMDPEAQKKYIEKLEKQHKVDLEVR